jgi:hypothetical protein
MLMHVFIAICPQSLRSCFDINCLIPNWTRFPPKTAATRKRTKSDQQTSEIFVAENPSNTSSKHWSHSVHQFQLEARAIEICRYFPMRELFYLERLAGCFDADASVSHESLDLIEAKSVPLLLRYFLHDLQGLRVADFGACDEKDIEQAQWGGVGPAE